MRLNTMRFFFMMLVVMTGFPRYINVKGSSHTDMNASKIDLQNVTVRQRESSSKELIPLVNSSSPLDHPFTSTPYGRMPLYDEDGFLQTKGVHKDAWNIIRGYVGPRGRNTLAQVNTHLSTLAMSLNQKQEMIAMAPEAFSTALHQWDAQGLAKVLTLVLEACNGRALCVRMPILNAKQIKFLFYVHSYPPFRQGFSHALQCWHIHPSNVLAFANRVHSHEWIPWILLQPRPLKPVERLVGLERRVTVPDLIHASRLSTAFPFWWWFSPWHPLYVSGVLDALLEGITSDARFTDTLMPSVLEFVSDPWTRDAHMTRKACWSWRSLRSNRRMFKYMSQVGCVSHYCDCIRPSLHVYFRLGDMNRFRDVFTLSQLPLMYGEMQLVLETKRFDIGRLMIQQMLALELDLCMAGAELREVAFAWLNALHAPFWGMMRIQALKLRKKLLSVSSSLDGSWRWVTFRTARPVLELLLEM